MPPIRTLIMGAAGRDFHNFNVYFRDNNEYDVIAFTATQIPNIEGRRYPTELAGSQYPNGIPIYPENDLVRLIQENEIASFLENKGEQVGLFPDLLKEKENLNKEILKISNDLDLVKLNIYNSFIEPIERLVEISHIFEEHENIEVITKLKSNAQRASRLAKELNDLDEKIRELIKKI